MYIYLYIIYMYTGCIARIPVTRSPCHCFRKFAVPLFVRWRVTVVSLESQPPPPKPENEDVYFQNGGLVQRSFLFNEVIFRKTITSGFSRPELLVELNRKLGGGGKIISCELNAASRLQIGAGHPRS